MMVGASFFAKLEIQWCNTNNDFENFSASAIHCELLRKFLYYEVFFNVVCDNSYNSISMRASFKLKRKF